MEGDIDLLKDLEIKGVDRKLTSFSDHFNAFNSAINFYDPIIYYILGFNCIILILAVLTRKKQIPQFILFIFICVVVFFIKPINEMLNKQWRKVASQNYFDESGIFLSVLLSSPLLVVGFFIVINALMLGSSGLVKLGQDQVKKKMLHEKILADKKNE